MTKNKNGDSNRFPPIEPGDMTEAQKRVVRELIGGPRGNLRGPFVALLRSPELMDRVQKLGEHIRYNSSVPERLREWAIAITAAQWRQNYEWFVHAPLAEKAGVSKTALDQLSNGLTPGELKDDEQVVYRFCNELMSEHRVSDGAFDDVKKTLGEQGPVELTALCGYYALLAMVLNMAETALPDNVKGAFERI